MEEWRESFIYFSIAIALSLSDVFSSSCYFIIFYAICSLFVHLYSWRFLIAIETQTLGIFCFLFDTHTHTHISVRGEWVFSNMSSLSVCLFTLTLTVSRWSLATQSDDFPLCTSIWLRLDLALSHKYFRVTCFASNARDESSARIHRGVWIIISLCVAVSLLSRSLAVCMRVISYFFFYVILRQLTYIYITGHTHTQTLDVSRRREQRVLNWFASLSPIKLLPVTGSVKLGHTAAANKIHWSQMSEFCLLSRARAAASHSCNDFLPLSLLSPMRVQ